ncbi:MAG: hypothetical protein Q8M29_09920 [Bacteroidota bacterium]|nr:hypothetical protein [Bacteroidota bacterium]
MTVEQKFKKASKLEGVLIIIGALSFICCYVFTLLHLGFRSQYGVHKQWQFLSTQQLWMINGALGLLGGIFLNYKKPIISGISGLVASIGITSFSLLYLSWREQVEHIESIIMLGIGIVPGVFLYKILNRDKKRN